MSKRLHQGGIIVTGAIAAGKWAAITGLALSLMACGALPRNSVPPSLVAEASVPGFGSIRYWGDEPPPGLRERAARNLEAMTERYDDEIAAAQTVDITFLALSGGGSDGAFGAGLLNGWTRSGERPEFDVVTGVSTGAILAPFAFLGPDYDDALRAAYTDVSQARIFVSSIFLNIFSGSALTSTQPFRLLIAEFADEKMLDDIAREHRAGRRLLVSTTNLDAGRPVVWDLGAIAASGRPGALALFRDVLLASASIPGAFPPVPIEVSADGRRYTELHVDGGVTSQVFTYQPQVELGRLLKAAPFNVEVTVYVIRNGKETASYEPIPRLWYSIMRRSLSVVLTNHAVGDLYRIYFLAERDGADFRLAVIPDNFAEQEEQPFERVYMRALFDLGYRMASGGYPWRVAPRGLTRPPCATDCTPSGTTDAPVTPKGTEPCSQPSQ